MLAGLDALENGPGGRGGSGLRVAVLDPIEEERPVTVPTAAFRFATGGPRVDTPPPRLGADTDAVLRQLGLADAEIGALHRDGVV